MVFENLLNPVFAPLLKLGYTSAIAIISLIIALIITLIYKYTTNQNLMKELKNELKAFQKQIKELRHDPQKAMAVQKEMMQTNMKYMMHSFKPMLYTFIPIIIIFGWLNAHMAYESITPDQEFTIAALFNNGYENKNITIINLPESLTLITSPAQTIAANKAEWVLKGQEGEYLLEFQHGQKVYSRELLISSEKGQYKMPDRFYKDDTIKNIKVNNNPAIGLNLGFYKFGWLGTYIIFSLIFSTLLRKLLKIY